MLNREEYNFTFDTDLTEEEFNMFVEESIYSMSYHELDDIRVFVRNHEWDDIPESIKEYLPIWEEFLAENL